MAAMDEPTNAAWEYKVLPVAAGPLDPLGHSIETRLNQMGELGWELVAVVVTHLPDSVSQLAYLKRRLA